MRAWPPLLLIVLLAGAALGTGDALAANPDDPEGVRARLDALVDELNDLDSWLSDAEQRRSRLQQELRAKDRAVAEADAAVASSDARLAQLRRESTRLEGERSELRASQTKESNRIGQHLAAAYRLRSRGFLELLLEQRSPATVQRLLIYHRYLVEARLAAIESLLQASAQLDENAAALASRQTAQAEEGERLIARKRELERNRHQRQSLITTLDKAVRDKADRRDALLRDRERLEALFAELQKQSLLLVGTGFANRKGALPWPLRGVLIARFGDARAGGRLKWQGVLLSADPGSPVKAIYRGRVVFADWLRGFGLLTILDHGDGYMTLYGHADRLAKRPGDMVESGEVIAHAGQSGGMNADGLYFEIRQDGNATDPLKWFVAKG